MDFFAVLLTCCPFCLWFVIWQEVSRFRFTVKYIIVLIIQYVVVNVQLLKCISDHQMERSYFWLYSNQRMRVIAHAFSGYHLICSVDCWWAFYVENSFVALPFVAGHAHCCCYSEPSSTWGKRCTLLIVWLFFFCRPNLSANLFKVIFINNNWRSHINLHKKSTSFANNAAFSLSLSPSLSISLGFILFDASICTRIAHCNMHHTTTWECMKIVCAKCRHLL